LGKGDCQKVRKGKDELTIMDELFLLVTRGVTPRGWQKREGFPGKRKVWGGFRETCGNSKEELGPGDGDKFYSETNEIEIRVGQ